MFIYAAWYIYDYVNTLCYSHRDGIVISLIENDKISDVRLGISLENYLLFQKTIKQKKNLKMGNYMSRIASMSNTAVHSVYRGRKRKCIEEDDFDSESEYIDRTLQTPKKWDN